MAASAVWGQQSEVINNNPAGAGSFPFAINYVGANPGTQVTFGPTSFGQTCQLPLLSPIPLVTADYVINTSALTPASNKFTLQGNFDPGSGLYDNDEIQYGGMGNGSLSFTGNGNFYFVTSGVSNVNGGTLEVSLSGPLVDFSTESNAFTNYDDNGSIDFTLWSGDFKLHDITYGLLNVGNGPFRAALAGGSLSAGDLTKVFQQYGTGLFSASIRNGNHAIKDGAQAFWTYGGAMDVNISGGTTTFSSQDPLNPSIGFVAYPGTTMKVNMSAGRLVFQGNACGFISLPGSTMEVDVSGGTLLIDGLPGVTTPTILGTTVNLTGNSVLFTDVNGLSIGGSAPGAIGGDYTGGITFTSSVTHIARGPSNVTPITLTTPPAAVGGPTASFITLGGATLNVVSMIPVETFAGRDLDFIVADNDSVINGNYGKLTSSSLIKYSVLYSQNPDKVTVHIDADQTWDGYVGSGASSNERAFAQYINTTAMPGDPIYVTLNDYILAGDTASYQAALDQLQPSQLSSGGMVAFTSATALTDLTARQIMTGLESPRNLKIEGVNSERWAAFNALVENQKNAPRLSVIQNASAPPRPHNAFTNSPEAINRHPFMGRAQVGRTNIWMQPYGQLMHLKGNDNIPGLQSKTAGFAAGADYMIDHNLLVGVLGGTSNTPLTWKQDRGWGNLKSGFGGVYAGWREESGLYLNGQAILGGNAIKSNRVIQYATINRTATSNHNAFQFTGNAEVGYDIPVYQGVTLQPFFMADYLVMNEAGYQESGAGTLSMAIQPRTSQFLQWDLGASVYKTFVAGETLLRPMLELGWVQRRALGSSTTSITGGFVNQPASLVVTGFNKVYNQLAPGAGLLAQFANGLYVSGDIYAETGDGLKVGEALLRMGCAF